MTTVVWSGYILLNPIEGFNYRIYKYFSLSSNSGEDVFHLQEHAGAIDRAYLDFTPFNLLIYKAVFAIQQSVPHAWHLYQLLWGWLAMALAWITARRHRLTPAQLWALALLMAISPAWLFLSALSGEDKLINAAVPLLLSLLVPACMLAALVLGSLYAGLSGFGVLFLPLLAIACWHKWPGQWRRLALLGVLAVVLMALTWLPWWPDNRVMLANRAHREALAPFWYSLWMLAPGLFSPLLGKALALVVVAFASLAYWQRRTSLLAAMLAVAFAYFATTNFLNHNRIAPMLILPLLALRRGPGWWTYAVLALIQLNAVLGFHLLHIPFPGPDALPWPRELFHVTLANMCLVTYLALFSAGFTARARSEPRPTAFTPSWRTR